MQGSADIVIYIATVNGLYRAEQVGGKWLTRHPALENLGTITTPVLDPEFPERVVAATMRAGIFRTMDGGANWEEINLGLSSQEVWSLSRHLVTGDLYAGTSPAALFKSTDGGNRWTECEEIQNLPERGSWSFPPPPHIPHIKQIALSEVDARLIFAAVEEGWVIRSRDGGATWKNLKEGVSFDAHCVWVSPEDPSLVVCTSGEGVYRSTNGGDTFVSSNKGLDRTYMSPVVAHVARPRILFTAAAEVPPPLWDRPRGACSAVFRSEDSGSSWNRLTEGLPDPITPAIRAIEILPENPDYLLVGMFDGTLWMSPNGGKSFQQIVGGLPSITGLGIGLV